MAEAVVSVVGTRLADLLIQETNLLSGVSEQVELLENELALLKSFLKDADERQHNDRQVRIWVSKIRDVAYDAEDIIESYVIKVALRRGGGIQKVLMRCACILDVGITLHLVGLEIAKILRTIKYLTTRLENYGIIKFTETGGPSSIIYSQRGQRQTYSHLEHDVVGLGDDVNKLLDFLLKEEEGNRVASICGMGGLGKTTLAKMVYNHDKVKQHFDCRAWVFISQQCQTRNVWEGILFSLLSPSEKERDEIRKKRDEEIVEKLLQVQREKKCLVILDEIWNTEHWDILCTAFPVNDIGSKILLTSRNKNVALHADPGFLHNLQILNDQKSWELLEKIAISWREDKSNHMETLAKEMVKYVGGVPLTITVLGGILATKHTVEEWVKVLGDVKLYCYEEDYQKEKYLYEEDYQKRKYRYKKEYPLFTKVMRLSYNNLPFQLKPCFQYLAHFPQGFEIPTKELFLMWMGEGLLPKFEYGGGREDTMEDVGLRYVHELVQRGMLQVGKIGSLGMIKTCVIHDLIREFCVSIAEGENFHQITNFLSMESEALAHVGKIRRLAINWDQDGFDLELPLMISKKYPHVRSLLYFSNDSVPYDVVKSMFKNFRSLRVLNLGKTKLFKQVLPKDIGCLIHLRFLSLKDTWICNVPSYLGKLRCLETLDLRIRHHLESNKIRVPNVFKKMKQLRHLYLPLTYTISEKLELTNSYYLQTLVNVCPKTIQLPTSFSFIRLRFLYVRSSMEWDTNTMVGIVSSCRRIYKLHLYIKIKKLPEVLQFSSNLVKLTFERTELEENPMETLEKLPNLKILHLLYRAFVGYHMVCSEKGFPQLQSLLLRCLENLQMWSLAEGAMPSLCHLQIESCSSLRSIPDGLRFVTTLRELEIKNMGKTFKDRVDKGEDFCKVQHVPYLVFQHCDGDEEFQDCYVEYQDSDGDGEFQDCSDGDEEFQDCSDGDVE